MMKELINAIGITPTQVRIFLFTFITVSVVVTLQHLGIRSPLHLF